MTRKKTSAGSTVTWCWRRWIAVGTSELWIQRLEESGCASWTTMERPEGVRVLLEAYVKSRAVANALVAKWKGSARAVHVREWSKMPPAPPTRIGRRLEIVHEKPRRRAKASGTQLYIPHGLAFGSGEHATTYMLLRELARRGEMSGMTVLDLGTGSGVLALAARMFDARKIVATDFDPDSVRTSSHNEALNFARPSIRWQRADVRKLRATTRYDLVLANLFSGILAEAAPQIAACVLPKGELWLSGVLALQEKDVTGVYRRQGMRLIRVFRRGKWVMLKLARSQ